MTLKDFSQNSSKQKQASGAVAVTVQIRGFEGDLQIIERLKELGFHQGLEIEVVGHAPFGGPQLFRFGNAVLALRQEEAACLLV